MIMEKIYQEENLFKFRDYLRDYGDALRTGIVQHDKEAVRKYRDRVKISLNNIVDLLIISSNA